MAEITELTELRPPNLLGLVVRKIRDALYICSFADAWADRVQICKNKGRPL